MRAANRRRAELGAIHLAKKQLGLDDEAYRDLLEELTGKRSAADLSALERAVVLDRMRALGFRRRDGSTGEVRRPTQREIAERLWADLGRMGALRDPSDAAFRSFIERQTGKSRLEWCTPRQINAVVEALKAWKVRARAHPDPET